MWIVDSEKIRLCIPCDFFVVLHITWWSKCFFSYMVSPRSCKVKAQKQWSKCADTQSKLCIIHKDAVSSIKETTFNSFSSADQNQYHCKQCRASVDSNEYKEPSYLDLHCLPFRFLYSWLSLSRPRLSRITAYLEVKIWSLPKHENLTTGEKYCGKEDKLLFRSNFSSFPQYFQYISDFKSPITY